MLSWLFGDILYYLALLSLAVGIGLYLVTFCHQLNQYLQNVCSLVSVGLPQSIVPIFRLLYFVRT